MIAIKNFQMPYDCSTCLFCVKRKTGDYGYYGSCYINNEDGINLLNHTRDSECPLVEIEVENGLSARRGKKDTREGCHN